MKDFKGKVAVITGAASGIGYGLAEHAAREGMKVVLADVEAGVLEKAEKSIKALGAETLAVKTDVSKAGEIKALADKTLDKFGVVHLLCNNAGVSSVGPSIWENTLADWQWVLGVNLWGVIHGIHFFVPIMIKQDTECHIVNTASAAGLLTGPGSSPYYITKHGVVALSEILYRELEQARHKVGVSVLCPGFIKTNIVECGRNRPKELENDPAEIKIKMADPLVQERIQFARQMIDGGMPPQQAADIVFNAIREKEFYILANAEQHKPVIQKRMEDILQQRNPSPLPEMK